MRVAVVGGGFAGLSAAIALQERRHDVVLLERRGVLGGRATSFRDAATGEDVDNGTHLMIAGYRETLDLVRRAGASDLLLVQDELRIDYVDDAGPSALACPPLVAPLLADVEHGPLRIGIGAGAGVAHVINTSAVSGLYDLDPFARAAAHSNVTWMLTAGADARVRVAGRQTPVRLELSLRWLGMGPTGIVREDHLPVGQISGAYLYPTPTETRFLVARAGVAIGG